MNCSAYSINNSIMLFLAIEEAKFYAKNQYRFNSFKNGCSTSKNFKWSASWH